MNSDLSATLSEFVGSMTMGVSVEHILDRFTSRLAEIMPVAGAGVTLVASESMTGYVTASSSTAMSYERLQSQMLEGPCVVALESGEVCEVPDLRAERRFSRYGPAASRAGLGAVFAFPLRTRGSTLGALDLYREVAGPLAPDDLEAVQVLSDVVATLVVNAQERRDHEAFSVHLEGIAHRDPLTALPNRLLLRERLEQAVRRSARSGRMFAIIFIDLDDFKTVNDRYGHGVGDELLTALGRRLTGVLRPADTLARFGGDEFVILCEDLDPAEGDQLTERIAEQFKTPFELSRAALHVRASIGVALSSADGDSPDALLRAADEAMYTQKRGPRREEPPAGRRSGADHRTETTDATVAALNADHRHIGRWEERWIGGSVSAGCAFALVAFNADTGELLITEYDNRVLMLRRHEWQIVARHDRPEDDIELITTDWDGQELMRRVVTALPHPPADSRELERLLSPGAGE